MLARYYAYALLRLSGAISADAFLGVLQRKGHRALLSSILKEYQKLLEHEKNVEGVTIRLKDKSAFNQEKERIKKYEEALGFNAEKVKVIEDPSIVGGFIIESGEHEVDGSYRNALVTLFRKMMRVTI